MDLQVADESHVSVPLSHESWRASACFSAREGGLKRLMTVIRYVRQHGINGKLYY